MTTTVPLSALATSLEAIDAPLTQKFLFPRDDVRLHRDMEYLWGLEIYMIDPRHPRSILHIRKSMQVPLPGSTCSWTLVPTEETLAAMDALQEHNFTVPNSERKSFLTEFSAPEYEYIFVPLYTDVDFFILQPGQAPQRYSAPYTDFPRVTSSANPFFVTFESRLKIQRYHVSGSKTWHRVFGSLTMHWIDGVLPEDFLMSYCPETLVSESDNKCEPEAPLGDPESTSGRDETVATPMDECPSLGRDKEAFVYDWVRRDASRPHERLILSSTSPPTPRGGRIGKVQESVRVVPQWCVESRRGKRYSKRLFTLS